MPKWYRMYREAGELKLATAETADSLNDPARAWVNEPFKESDFENAYLNYWC